MLMPEQMLGKSAHTLGRGGCCPRGPPSVGLAGRFSGRGILEDAASRYYYSLIIITSKLRYEPQRRRAHRDA